MDINSTDELVFVPLHVLHSTACPLAFLTNICSRIVTLDVLWYTTPNPILIAIVYKVMLSVTFSFFSIPVSLVNNFFCTRDVCIPNVLGISDVCSVRYCFREFPSKGLRE